MKGYALVLLLSMASMECVAGFDEGVKAYGTQDYQTALKEFLPLANGGNASAQYNLGIMYRNGQGVPQNYTQALQWYLKAADQGIAEAQFNLGVMYYNGQEVPQNYSQAADGYRKAVEQGY